MIRPMTFLGALVVAIASFSYFMIPAWHDSPLGLVMLILCALLGSTAISLDLYRFWQDLQRNRVSKLERKADDPADDEDPGAPIP